MRVMAISGSYRKGGTIETLMEKASEGICQAVPEAEVYFLRLMDKKIEYCKNCMVCRKDGPEKELARCIIDDDMTGIYALMAEADAYILGTPVNIGHVTAVMKTFLERIVWVMSKPGDTFPVKGCPVPRGSKKRSAIVIVSSGLVPPILRMFCDMATPLLKDICDSSLNASVAGTMYAGAVEKKGVEAYFKEAEALGRKLAQKFRKAKDL
jgi:NAD(P)H-dependent FMN reductase